MNTSYICRVLVVGAVIFTGARFGRGQATASPPAPVALTVEQLREITRQVESKNYEAFAAAGEKRRMERMAECKARFEQSSEAPGLRELESVVTAEEGAAFFGPLLNHQNEGIRRAALHGLAQWGTRTAALVPRMMAIYESGNDEERTLAAAAIGAVTPPARDAIPMLAKGVAEPMWPLTVRIASIRALANMGPAAQAALPMLEDARHAIDGQYAYEAFAAIEKIAPAEPMTVGELSARQLQAFRGKEVFRAFAGLRQLLAYDAKPSLLPILFSDLDAPVTITAIKMLEGMDLSDARSLEALLDIRGRGGDAASNAAAVVLRKFRLRDPEDREVPAVLARYVKHADNRAGVEALDLLLRAGPAGEAAIPAVVELIAEGGDKIEPRRFVKTLQFLRMHGERARAAAPVLAKLLLASQWTPAESKSDYAHPDIYLNILATFGDIGLPDDVRPLVIQALGHPMRDWVFAAGVHAAAAMKPAGDEVIDRLIKSLEGEDSAIIRATDWVGEVYAAPEGGTTVQLELMQTLSRIGGERAKPAIPLLRELAKRGNSRPVDGASYQEAAEKAIAAISR